MKPNPELEQAFENLKSELLSKGLTPRHPLKRSNTEMAKKNETTEKTAKAKKEPKTEKAPAFGYSLADFAKDLKAEPVEVRKALRGLEAKKPEGSRWGWKNADEAAKLRGQVAEWLKTDGRKDNPGRPRKDAGVAEAASKTDKKSAPAKKAAPAKKLTKKAK